MMFKPKHILLFCNIVLLLGTSCGVSKSLNTIPSVKNYNTEKPQRIKLTDSTFKYKNNVLTKNKQGLWELYVEGDAYQRGLITGHLTQELFNNQEAVFLSKINELVPSKFKQQLLRRFLAWYNRKMYLHIPEEYKTEILGISKYASKHYNYIAKPYLRVLYFHGAHDIGHALQDLALVGCSSFATWGNKTEDGKLLIGRNFDFYAGDDFSKHKIIAFVNPTHGHKFMSVTWGGMIGVLSGMNEHGLTVTINAGKSKIPLVAKTPISIVTREILQYASTISEAIAIAKKRRVFVSESILIGSAKDNRAISIEVSPRNFGVYQVTNSNQLICTNHFQSKAYSKDKNNSKHIRESHSDYRFKRMKELLNTTKKLTPKKAVSILRNKEGLNNKQIGYGNEKALNQLLAHHSIVFKPEDRLVWVSSNPYQLGAYVAYNLNEIFKSKSKTKGFSTPNLIIEKDDFQYTNAFKNYETYRVLSQKIIHKTQTHTPVSPKDLKTLQDLNPNFWESYYIVGKYYYKNKFYNAALNAFKQALTKEVTTLNAKMKLEKYIKKLKRKIN